MLVVNDFLQGTGGLGDSGSTYCQHENLRWSELLVNPSKGLINQPVWVVSVSHVVLATESNWKGGFVAFREERTSDVWDWEGSYYRRVFKGFMYKVYVCVCLIEQDGEELLDLHCFVLVCFPPLTSSEQSRPTGSTAPTFSVRALTWGGEREEAIKKTNLYCYCWLWLKDYNILNTYIIYTSQNKSLCSWELQIIKILKHLKILQMKQSNIKKSHDETLFQGTWHIYCWVTLKVKGANKQLLLPTSSDSLRDNLCQSEYPGEYRKIVISFNLVYSAPAGTRERSTDGAFTCCYRRSLSQNGPTNNSFRYCTITLHNNCITQPN